MTAPAAAPGDGEGLRERPLRWIARLGRELRREGVRCTPAESVAALAALDHLDLADPLDAYHGLRAVFLTDPSEGPAFDRCFWALWGREQSAGLRVKDARRPGGMEPARGARRPGERFLRAGDWESRGLLERLRVETSPEAAPPRAPNSEEEGEATRRVGVAYSPSEGLARRSFASLGPRELREVDAAFDRLRLRLATRRSRRRRPTAGRRGSVDVRRSLRHALGHEGELLRLARRRRREERPKVVLLCDVSGSMERYSRFLVRFVLAAGRERDVETFVFSTGLTRLTPHLARSSVDEALTALAERVPDWSGGTRIGSSLEAFLERHGRTLLGQRTVVVVLSDGLDRGETASLERAMRAIQRRSRKVIWLNPLLESPDYRPEARGMKAALPYVDELASGHSLRALRELAAMIRL